MREGCYYETHLKDSFLTILGDVSDLDFIFGEGALGQTIFTHCGLDFSCGSGLFLV